MTDMIAHALTAKELAEGKTRMRLAFSSPDGPPPPGVEGPVENGYSFHQSTPVSLWIIKHDLGYYPSLTVQNTIGQEQRAIAECPSNMELLISFSELTQGWAWLRRPTE